MKPTGAAPATLPLLDPTAWPLLLGLAAIRVLSSLPERSWPSVSRALGWVMRRSVPRRRRVVEVNLARALPELSAAARERVVSDCFDGLALSLLETGKLWFGPVDFAKRRVKIVGLENWQAVSLTHPVLLTTPHMMSIELVGLALCQHAPLSAFYARAKNPHFERFEVAKRLRFAKSVIERHQTRKLVRTLRDRGSVWWVPDQSVVARHAAVESRFFAQPVMSSRATAWLLEKLDARVLFVDIHREENGQLVVTINPPTEALSGDASAVTTQLDAHFETMIRRQPSEYFWMHRRFKPVQPTDPDPYRET